MLKKDRKLEHLEYLNCIAPPEIKDIVSQSSLIVHSINKGSNIAPKAEYDQNIRKNRGHQSNTRKLIRYNQQYRHFLFKN